MPLLCFICDAFITNKGELLPCETGRSPGRQLAQPPLRPCPALVSCALRISLPSAGSPEGSSISPTADGHLSDQALLWDQPLFQLTDFSRSKRMSPCIQQPDLSVTHMSTHLLTFSGCQLCQQRGLWWDSEVPQEPRELKGLPALPVHLLPSIGFPIPRTSRTP